MRSETTKKLLWKAGALGWSPCRKVDEDKYPPERILSFDGYTYLLEDSTDEDVKITLLAKQTLHLKTIKNIVIFFLTMWLIGTIITIAYTVKFMTAISSIM